MVKPHHLFFLFYYLASPLPLHSFGEKEKAKPEKYRKTKCQIISQEMFLRKVISLKLTAEELRALGTCLVSWSWFLIMDGSNDSLLFLLSPEPIQLLLLAAEEKDEEQLETIDSVSSFSSITLERFFDNPKSVKFNSETLELFHLVLLGLFTWWS